MFETRALTAEEDAQDLRNQVGELQTQVVELKGRVGELEDENHSLRSGQARK
jgi:regulator of replication initiation timing